MNTPKNRAELRDLIAKACMGGRINGGCIVQDWEQEAKDNPHVAQAINQANTIIDALEAAGVECVPVDATDEMEKRGDKVCEWGTAAIGVYGAMIAASPYRKEAE